MNCFALGFFSCELSSLLACVGLWVIVKHGPFVLFGLFMCIRFTASLLAAL